MIELFAVYDSAAEAYTPPFPAATIAVAIRGFQQSCEKEGHPFQMHPSDYVLYHVGTFDDDLGEVHGWKEARKIAMATTFNAGFSGPRVDESWKEREVGTV